MIQLNVTLDPVFVRQLRLSGWEAMDKAWIEVCGQYSVQELGGVKDFFQTDREVTSYELSLLEDTVSLLDLNLTQSIEHVTRWMPDIADDAAQFLTVLFLPHGKYTFGAKPGLQFFSLYPDALPVEAYLFLVHVYYHELSSLNDTPKGTRCSREQSSSADFKDWIRLLIRNEGIGNFAILSELDKLKETNPNYVFRYFTYARMIDDRELLHGAVKLLKSALTEVNDANVCHFRNGINKIFRNEALPIMNLVGIHMAQSIVKHYNAATLRNVYQRDAEEFFALYGGTDAPFAKTLKEL